MPCPDEETLLRFADGSLEAAALEQLEAHFDGCPSCRALAGWAGRSATRAGAPAAAPLSPGARVGRYVIERQVGAGSMGTVYAAHDPQLDRKVALKLLRAESGGSAAHEERLLREARAMARLSHPNVVPVFDAGTDGAQLFVAMELIEGHTLRGWLRAAPRAWREVLDAFFGAGEGLAAAHASGIIHRDFKPDNVLVDAAGVARVTDFGLARSADGSAVESSDPAAIEKAAAAWLTRTGDLVGTPAYMSPEQLEGKPADARSDCFCFAVALYEALHGQRPFPGDSIEQLRAALKADRVRPAPPGRKVPAAVRRVLLRALKNDPAARPPSMRALLDQLRSARGAGRRAAAIAAALALIALALFAARSGGRGASATEPRAAARAGESTVALVPSSARVCLEPGGSAQLSAELRDARVIGEGMRRPSQELASRWSSADPAVATVSADGRVTAVAPGRTALTAEAGEARSKPIIVSVAPAPRGRMVYDTLEPGGERRLIHLVDLDGKSPSVVAEGANPRLSPDQSALLYQRGGKWAWGPGDSLYLLELRSGLERTLKANTDYIVSASFTNDGKQVVFDHECDMERVGSDGAGEAPLFRTRDCYDDSPDVNPVDGSVVFQNIQGAEFINVIRGDGDLATRRTIPGTANDYGPRWAPDGVHLSVWHGDASLKGDLELLRADGSEHIPLLPFPVDEHNYVWHSNGAFTPDGRWLVAAVTRGDAARTAVEIEALATDGSGCTRVLDLPGASRAGIIGSIR